MPVRQKLVLSLCVLGLVSAPLAIAQTATKPTPPTSPFTAPQDPNKLVANQKPPERTKGPLPPLVFHNELPKTPVAVIDGKPVTQGQLLKYLIKGNWATVAQTLILVNLLDIELKKAKLEVTADEIHEEEDAILQKVAPGKTVAEIKKMNAFSESEMRRQAWLQRGWKKLFISQNRLSADNVSKPETNILIQLLIRQTMDKYEIRQRGFEPPPSEGYIAEVREKEGTEVRKITADQGLDFLMGLVKPGSLREAVEDLVDSEIVNRQLAKADKVVTEEEVEAWAGSMIDKYPPPFDWRMICQFRQTTPDQERERWRRIQSWKRVTGTQASPDEIKKFISENEDHYSGMNKSVSHILIKTTDPVTAMPATEATEIAAKQKIDEISQKIKEGVDFGYLAEHYSDDVQTAKGKGVLSTPIKKIGGGLDPAFQAAAWKLQVGEVSPPVKTKFGWHVIKCDKITPGQRSGKDFDDPNYREWIVDEYETIKMHDWLNGLHAAAKVEIVPHEELVKLKELNFGEVPKKN